MSLLDVWITPSRALMAVDTDGVSHDGHRLPASKLLPIPHLNAVIGLRGQLAFFSFIYIRILSSAFNTFDELDDAFPFLLYEAETCIPPQLIVGTHGALSGNELVAIGWSHRRKRMVGRQFVKRGDMTEFSALDIDRHVSPWGEWANGLNPVQEAVGQIASAQVRWMRETFPNAACGGRLITCSLGRDSMTLRQEFNFQPAEATA